MQNHFSTNLPSNISNNPPQYIDQQYNINFFSKQSIIKFDPKKLTTIRQLYKDLRPLFL